ncbi:hypothetical protein M440DRAFT_1011238 [Trichoderma longibrachiatum ATCC 18648]|uniref:Uncharacterized protein n=1 Tax=Trichoderma longibrachiatum ATCC 18648 TaxID=983965 RepID=A0A2T4CI65_TRILO|nr:hypothetical protein M440DRAFT_1011238 [Trichoderma longibrachiatum ATCC 18648]
MRKWGVKKGRKEEEEEAQKSKGEDPGQNVFQLAAALKASQWAEGDEEDKKLEGERRRTKGKRESGESVGRGAKGRTRRWWRRLIDGEALLWLRFRYCTFWRAGLCSVHVILFLSGGGSWSATAAFLAWSRARPCSLLPRPVPLRGTGISWRAPAG